MSKINIFQGQNVKVTPTTTENRVKIKTSNNNDVNIIQSDIEIVGISTGPQGSQGDQGPSGSQGPPGINADTGSFVTTSSFNFYTGSLTSQFAGTASYALNAETSSFALTASYLNNYIPPFPYTGSAIITGSLNVIGPVTLARENPTDHHNLIIETNNTYGEIMFTGSGVANINSLQSDLRLKAGIGQTLWLGADNINGLFRIIEDGNANIKGGLRNVKIRADEGYTLGLGANNVNDIILISSSKAIISNSTTSELLRITQTGTGDAIRIEDSTNPDSTPTVLTNAGDLFIGSDTAPTTLNGINTPKLYVKNGSSGYTGTLAIDTAALFEGNGAGYFATLSPDSSPSGLYMGSPSDPFGAVIRWGYDFGNLQLIAASVGHGITFQVGNKSTASMTLQPFSSGTGNPTAVLNLTGSLKILNTDTTNSTIIESKGTSGDLFSVTDTLSGSLFNVNNISGLPVFEVFSDNRILQGNFTAPLLNTTTKTTVSSIGSFIIYELPTSSYDGAFFEYIARSGSNARAGQIMSLWSGSQANSTETTTTAFGSTSALNFSVEVIGSNFALTGSVTTPGWTIKTIIRSI